GRPSLLARPASFSTTAAGAGSAPALRACPASGGARDSIHAGQASRVRLAWIEYAQFRFDPCRAAASAHHEHAAVPTRRGRRDPDVDALGDWTDIDQPLTGGGIGRSAIVLGDSAPEAKRGGGEEWATSLGAQDAHDRRPT